MIRRPAGSTLFPYTTLFRSNDTATTEIYTLSLHDALGVRRIIRSEEHTSELQSHDNLVCRLLLEKNRQLPLPVLEFCPGLKTEPEQGSGKPGKNHPDKNRPFFFKRTGPNLLSPSPPPPPSSN